MEYPVAAFRYMRNIRMVRGACMPKRMKKTKVCWLWGASGVGKSYYARARAGPDADHHTADMGKWWCTYTGQKKVLMDEYRDSVMPMYALCGLMDEGPHRVQTKGGSVEYAAEELIITSNASPYEMYMKVRYKEPLWRRIEHHVYEIKCPPGNATLTATPRPDKVPYVRPTYGGGGSRATPAARVPIPRDVGWDDEI